MLLLVLDQGGVDTQTLLLILQIIVAVVIAVLTITISWLVARKYGERAAIDYESHRDDKRNHAVRLSAESGRLMGALPYRDSALECWWQSPELVASPQPNFEGLPYETKLLLNHLATGQTDLNNSIREYRQAYDTLANAMLEVYRTLLAGFRRSATTHAGRWFSEPGFVTQSLAQQTIGVMNNNTGPISFSLNSANGCVKLVNVDAYMTEVDTDASLMINDLNAVSSRAVAQLRSLWDGSAALVGRRRAIEDKLHEINVLALDGVPLEGWCDAGVKAGFEKQEDTGH